QGLEVSDFRLTSGTARAAFIDSLVDAEISFVDGMHGIHIEPPDTSSTYSRADRPIIQRMRIDKQAGHLIYGSGGITGALIQDNDLYQGGGYAVRLVAGTDRDNPH